MPDLSGQLLRKCVFLHTPFPVSALSRWLVHAALCPKAKIILHRHNNRIGHRLQGTAYQTPHNTFLLHPFQIQIIIQNTDWSIRAYCNATFDTVTMNKVDSSLQIRYAFIMNCDNVSPQIIEFLYVCLIGFPKFC